MTRNGGRTAGTPRTGPVSRGCPARDPSAASPHRSVDKGFGVRYQPCGDSNTPGGPARGCRAACRRVDEMVPAIVLAAGASSRMGRPKALLPVAADGTTFLEHLVRTLRSAGVDDVIVVVGHDADLVRGLIESAGLAVRTAVNKDPSRGQLSSLIAALDIADRPGVQAVLVAPVDQPLVAVETVRRLLDTYRRARAPIVRPARGGRHGHPVVFDRSLFDELHRADPAAGAREVIQRHRPDVIDVAVDDEGAFVDIDTPEAYARVMRGRG